MYIDNVSYPSCDGCKHKDVCKYKEKMESLQKRIKVSKKDAEEFCFISFECKCKYYESSATTGNITLWAGGDSIQALPCYLNHQLEPDKNDPMVTPYRVTCDNSSTGIPANADCVSTKKEN